MTRGDPLALIAAHIEETLEEAGQARQRPPEPEAEPEPEPAPLESWGERPDTIAAMRDAVLDLLWSRIPTFKETALARTADMLTKLTTADVEAAPEPEAELDVFDLIQTEGLLPVRKRELLTAEWDRLAGRMERITRELEGL